VLLIDFLSGCYQHTLVVDFTTSLLHDLSQLVADFQPPYCMTPLNWMLISNLPTTRPPSHTQVRICSEAISQVSVGDVGPVRNMGTER
jgi:hypothetical protein